MENYLSCTHNDPAQRADYQHGPENPLEPGPDYYAPTGHYQSGGRGHGGPDHVNWCESGIISNDTPITEGLGRRPRVHVRVTFAEEHDPAARGTERVSSLFIFLFFQVPRHPRPLQGPLPVDSRSCR
jgi:hypothetical protein